MIHMDSMHFGMGNCCLQITYETQSVNHARYLYDMFIPFTPIFSALSQASPIYKGKLSDYDFRWETIEMGTDCRTAEERDPNNPSYLHKPRYSAASHYLSNHEFIQNYHNDTRRFPVCVLSMQEFKHAGLDPRMAYHMASLFVRSPVPAYQNELEFPEIEELTQKMR